MDSYWETQNLNNDLSDDDVIPRTQLPVTILGEVYSALYDREEIRSDIQSRIWVTYRRGFLPISGANGFTSDMGWGCMHRCGQMMLAQALMVIHMGRNWRWYQNMDDAVYHKILSMFHDNRNAPYSIHMISSFGQVEGKSIGKWFGPNTVAQVLKNLSKEDKMTNLVIHITMENGVIIDEIVSECRRKAAKSSKKEALKKDEQPKPISKPLTSRLNQPLSQEIDDNCVEIVIPPTVDSLEDDAATMVSRSLWRPLLLIIPVRLGLNELNECYVPAIRDIFQIPQCVGIIGGRPSHALWFIGQVGNELIFLDPHETQPIVPMESISRVQNDQSYHCSKWLQMPILKVDPSLAIGFICTNEESFLDLCEQLKRKILLPAGKHPMFEIHQKRPCYFPPLYNGKISIYGSDDSEEEFELL